MKNFEAIIDNVRVQMVMAIQDYFNENPEPIDLEKEGLDFWIYNEPEGNGIVELRKDAYRYTFNDADFDGVDPEDLTDTYDDLPTDALLQVTVILRDRYHDKLQKERTL